MKIRKCDVRFLNLWRPMEYGWSFSLANFWIGRLPFAKKMFLGLCVANFGIEISWVCIRTASN
jgi:hypothetical protein